MRVRSAMAGCGLLASVLLVLLAPATGVAGERRVERTEGIDYYGGDLRTLKDLTVADCEAACLAEPACQAFTFNIRVNWCFLKTSAADPRPFAAAISGKVVSGPAGAPAELIASRRAELAIVPAMYREEAAELARRVRAGTSAPAHTAEPVAAALRALPGAPASTERWLRVAEAALAVDSNHWDRQQRAAIDATAAAINAYLSAAGVPERLAALGALGRGLERRAAYRPAIRVYRAALTLAADPELAAHLEELVAKHGFRVVEHRVDADAAAPRICVRFSDPLARDGGDIADYFQLDRDGLAVEPEASQVCIDGVRHGEKYRLTVRAGLPGDDGERLAEAVELEVYVPDRAPQVRFPGRAYVLPRGGEATLPVVTVNTDRVEAALYRISDAALGGFAAGEDLFAQLTQEAAGDLADRRGERLWQGPLEVRQALNEEVTTAIPVGQLLAAVATPSQGGLEPGVYVMTARVPTGAGEDQTLATQWFVVSDLGLAALSGGDGLHAMVRSLGSAAPLAGVRMRLLAVNQRLLAEAVTDDQGYARFAPGLLRGTGGNAPALLVAQTADDYGFLDLTASPFDLSDRGVDGRPAPQPLDVYLVAERGIYRPGETVFLTALLRDARANAVLDVPLTFIVKRPDGVEHLRDLVPDQGGGGRVLALPLLPNAMRGVWQVQVSADPKGEALTQVPFLVEDFQPERLDFTLTPDAPLLDPEDPAGVALQARFLYGAPAARLPVEGQLRVEAANGLPAWPGVRFGLAEEPFEPQVQPLSPVTTDETGAARLALALPPGLGRLSAVSRPLTARVSVGVVDAGRPVERDLTLPIADRRPRIGIRPLFDGAVEEGGNARFEVIAVAPDGSRLAPRGLRWTLSRVQSSFQWYQTDGEWRFEPVVNRSRVASGRLDVGTSEDAGQAGSTDDGATVDAGVDADGAPVGRIEARVDWGAYRLEVTGSEAADPLLPVSMQFEAGWYVTPKAFDTPDALKVSLDKAEYRVGETARVRLEPRFPGLALVMVIDDGLKVMQPVAVPAEGVTVDLPVTADWGPGAYVTAMLYRGMDLAARRMPRRAIGLHWLAIDPGDRRLAVQLDLPTQAEPRGPLTIGVDVDNLLAGAEAHVAVAAVDQGILNLTRFTPWSPEHWYFGQRRLSMALRDLYGRLIDRLQGEPGRLRSGAGSLALLRAAGPPPSEALLAFHSGVLRADDEGKVRLDFPLPDFNGSVRVMAMAWSVGGVGSASAEVLVRDPVVIAPALPRFLAPGDRSRLLLELTHVQGPAGAMEVQVSSPDRGLLVAGDGQPIRVQVPAGGRAPVSVALTAVAPGDHRLAIRLRTPDGRVLTKTLRLGVRDLTPPVQQSRAVELPPLGAPLRLDPAMLSAAEPESSAAAPGPLAGLPALVPGTGEWLVSVTGVGALDLVGLVRALDRFPYGCLEQTVSRALPLLYLDQVALLAGLPADADVPGRIRDAVTQVLASQGASGGFGLWGPPEPWNGADLWLNAYAADFLTRAREQGYSVPDLAFSLALDNLKNQLGYQNEFEGGGEGVAYGLYVLARNGRVPLGDLRWFLETRLERFATPLARAQIGAALALMGERERADRAFAAAWELWQEQTDDGAWRLDFGSRLRDGAALLALAAEADSDAVDRAALTAALAAEPSRLERTSTQEQAWLVLAAQAASHGAAAPVLSLNGAPPVSGPLFRRLTADGLTVANLGKHPVTALVTAIGVPAEAPPAGGNGYRIERAWYDLDGRRLDPAKIAQGTRLVVVLTMTADTKGAARLVIDDPLPAGLEIDNPHLLQAASVGNLRWMNLVEMPVHAEFRAERFIAAVDRSDDDPQQFQLAWQARAVSPGTFAYPAAVVEDLYRPTRRGWTATGSVTVTPAGD